MTGIVRILTPDGSTAGTGFVVTDDGLIATCSRVVQSEKSQRRGDPRPDYADLVFHATGDCRRARVGPEWWRLADAEFFFGREGLVADLVDHLRGNPRFPAQVFPGRASDSVVPGRSSVCF
jgi:hypothetical protein